MSRISKRKIRNGKVERESEREKERKEKKERESTRFMIKERRGRIIVVAGSSASFIDNDSVDKKAFFSFKRAHPFRYIINRVFSLHRHRVSPRVKNTEHSFTSLPKRLSFLSPFASLFSSFLSPPPFSVIYIFYIYNRRGNTDGTLTSFPPFTSLIH